MSEDWKPGDQAQCIKQGKWNSLVLGIPVVVEGPQFLNVYEVVDIFCPDNRVFLALAGFDGVWLADHFRKPDPLELDEDDREVIEGPKEFEPS